MLSNNGKPLLIVLIGILILQACFTGVIFWNSRSFKAQSNHYPTNIKFEGNKVGQYFIHGRNGELRADFELSKPGKYFIRVSTNELYKLYINDQFAAFNWSPTYQKEFGTNRVYKKEFPLVNISNYLKKGINKLYVVGNFSYERPSGNYIAFEIKDGSGAVVLSKRNVFPLIKEIPYYSSLPLILSILSFFYLLFLFYVNPARKSAILLQARQWNV